MGDADEYFPPGVFSYNGRESLLADWCSSFLAAMGEPPLWSARTEAARHAYRFLWLRSFHPPIALRLEIGEAEGATLPVKVSDGQGGYEPGKLVIDRTVPLSRAQITDFLTLLARARFWELPVTDRTRMGMDGAEWVLEGLQGGRHRVVARWCPDEGAFRDAALTLVRLGGLEIESIY
jgi:hypothetical protein